MPLLLRLGLCLSLGGSLLWAETGFDIKDPRNDDFGNGQLLYPANANFTDGDLDLVQFSAKPTRDGTWFHARFANRIRHPKTRVGEHTSVPMADHFEFDFHNINLDIYIDTDGQPGSGNTNTLPGRSVAIHPHTGWEKAVILVPRPREARSLLKRYMTKTRRKERELLGERLEKDTVKQLKQEVGDLVEKTFFFPTRITVRGPKISFFVPNEFLGESARNDWHYAVLVTGADPEQRVELSLLGRKPYPLMMLPVSSGRPLDHFGIELNADPHTPPVVDVLLPDERAQQRILSDFDAAVGRLVQIPGIAPNQPAKLPPLGRVSPPATTASTKAPAAPRVATPARPKPNTPAKPEVEAANPTAPQPLATPKPLPKAASETDRLLKRPHEQPKTQNKPGIAERLKELENLREQKLISEKEYQQLRRKILAEL